MIEDPHERTRAILWMLADAEPGMPLLRALGHLKAVELELEKLERAGMLAENAGKADPRYQGSGGISNLVKDMAGVRPVVEAARRGDKARVGIEIIREVGPGTADTKVLLLACDSLVNMYRET